MKHVTDEHHMRSVRRERGLACESRERAGAHYLGVPPVAVSNEDRRVELVREARAVGCIRSPGHVRREHVLSAAVLLERLDSAVAAVRHQQWTLGRGSRRARRRGERKERYSEDAYARG